MKQLFTLLITVSLTTQTFAQTTTHWQPYVRGSIGGAWASGETKPVVSSYMPYKTALISKDGSEVGLLAGSIGVGIAIPVKSHFTIQAEVSLEQKGFRTDVDMATTYCAGGNCGIVYQPPTSIPATGQVVTRLTYLTVPVLAGYRAGKLFMVGGPQMGFKLTEKQRGHYQLLRDNAYNSINEFNIQSNEFRLIDVGVAASVGYFINSRLCLDLRYSQSLIRANQQRGYSIEAAYNRTAQLALRYNLLR